MLINDNHKWYLLIAKDEMSGIAREKESENNEHAHTFAHICDYMFGVRCVSVSARTGPF